MKDKKPLIIWVDDDFSLRILAERVLLQAGFECITAGSGQEMLVLLNKLKPDLILLDVEMPEMDGFEVCAAIRKHTSNHAVPILTVTCHEDFNSIGRAFDVGATDFMTKPLNWKLLVYRIQYMLRSDRVINNLRLCKSRLQNVQKAAQLGTWEWNNKTGQMYFSPEAYQLFGLPDQAMMNYQQLIDSIHPDDKEHFCNTIKSTIEQGVLAHFNAFKIEHRIIHADGSVRHIVQYGEVASDHSDQPHIITAAIQDLSQQKHSESGSAVNLEYASL